MRLFGWYIQREPFERVVERVEVPVPVLGAAELVTLYRAEDDPHRSALGYYIVDDDWKPADWHGRLFHSCEQAFAAHPSAKLTPVSAFKVAGKHFLRRWSGETMDLLEVEPQPKPKVAKGKRA